MAAASDSGMKRPGDEEEVIDVLDFPQLYQRPPAAALFSILAQLTLTPASWDGTRPKQTQGSRFNESGIPAYLTSIISSSLNWIETEDDRDHIWETAAQRLSERSGRSAMGDLTRTFRIPIAPCDAAPEASAEEDKVLEIVLHEPAMTADNLGLKTWGTSFTLAKRLLLLREHIPPLTRPGLILELGSGTGLAGLAAAAIFRAHVILTDLADIVPNLKRNAATNADTIALHGGSVEAAVLDWCDPSDCHSASSNSPLARHSVPLILVADPIYSSEHPYILTETVGFYLSRAPGARLVIELPLRDAYAAERADLKRLLTRIGLQILDQGEDVGYDDWMDGDELAQVPCWWSVWGRMEYAAYTS